MNSTTITWTILFLLFGACSGQGNQNTGGVSRCTPGASLECACVDGSKGAQICTDKGTLEPCRCAPQGGSTSGATSSSASSGAGGTTRGTGGSGGSSASGGRTGGTGGSGGSSASGGRTGGTGGSNAGGTTGGLAGAYGTGGSVGTGGKSAASGGSTGSGRTASEHIFFNGTVTYATAGQPDLVRVLSVCSRCEASYDSTFTAGLITFWVNEDIPQWWSDYADMSMTFNSKGIEFRPAEYKEPYYGAYAQEGYDTLTTIPYAESCVHATEHVIAATGHVKGTLDCKLTRRDTNKPAATAHVVGSFYAEIPSKDP